MKNNFEKIVVLSICPKISIFSEKGRYLELTLKYSFLLISPKISTFEEEAFLYIVVKKIVCPYELKYGNFEEKVVMLISL